MPLEWNEALRTYVMPLTDEEEESELLYTFDQVRNLPDGVVERYLGQEVIGETEITDEMMFSYYDLFNRDDLKPLIPSRGQVSLLPPEQLPWGHNIPTEITDENFERFLPTVTSNLEQDRVDHQYFTPFLDYVRLLGFEDFVQPRLSKVCPIAHSQNRRFDDPYGHVSCGATLEFKGFYTGGWKKEHLAEFIRENRETLRRVFPDEVLPESRPRYDSVVHQWSHLKRLRLKSLVSLAALIIYLRQHPDAEASDELKTQYSIAALSMEQLTRQFRENIPGSRRLRISLYNRLTEGDPFVIDNEIDLEDDELLHTIEQLMDREIGRARDRAELRERRERRNRMRWNEELGTYIHRKNTSYSSDEFFAQRIFEQVQNLGIEEVRQQLLTEFRRGEQEEEIEIKEDMMFSYYDLFDRDNLKPFIPNRDDIRRYRLQPEEHDIPTEITEENFERFLPTITSNEDQSPYRYAYLSGFKKYLPLLGLDEFVLPRINIVCPLFSSINRRIERPYEEDSSCFDDGVVSNPRGHGFYTGGWKRDHLIRFLKRNRETLLRVFPYLPLGNNWGLKQNFRIKTMLELAALVIYLQRNPEVTVSEELKTRYSFLILSNAQLTTRYRHNIPDSRELRISLLYRVWGYGGNPLDVDLNYDGSDEELRVEIENELESVYQDVVEDSRRRRRESEQRAEERRRRYQYSDVSDDEDPHSYTLVPGEEEERGRPYLKTFIDMSIRREGIRRKQPLGYQLEIRGEAGEDYSGIFRDAVTDLVAYWFISLAFNLTEDIGYTVSYPRLVDEINPNQFGYVLGYLAKIVEKNPTVNNYNLNLGIGVNFDHILWAVYRGENITRLNVMGYYLENLTAEHRVLLIKRLSRNINVTVDDYNSYQFVDSITRIVTNSCENIDEIKEIIRGNPIERIIYAIIAIRICSWDEDIVEAIESRLSDSDSDSDSDKDSDRGDEPSQKGGGRSKEAKKRRHKAWLKRKRDKRGKQIKQDKQGEQDKQSKQEPKRIDIEEALREEFAKGVTEYQYLEGWLLLYGQFLYHNAKVKGFLTGLQGYCKDNKITDDMLPILVRGDGFTNETIRPALLERISGTGREELRPVLERLSYRQIRQLLKFWTGTDQLTAKLKIQPVRSSDRLPEAHTCFNQLDIASNQLENPDLLLGKLTTAIEHGAVGTGFI